MITLKDVSTFLNLNNIFKFNGNFMKNEFIKMIN